MTTKKLFILFVLLATVIPLAACAPKPMVSNFSMAKDDQGANKTSTFAPTDAFNLFFNVSGIPGGTQFETRWYVLNASGVDPNTPFKTLDQSYDGKSTAILFHLANNGNWPVGDYRVDVYMSGNQVGQVKFSVTQ